MHSRVMYLVASVVYVCMYMWSKMGCLGSYHWKNFLLVMQLCRPTILLQVQSLLTVLRAHRVHVLWFYISFTSALLQLQVYSWYHNFVIVCDYYNTLVVMGGKLQRLFTCFTVVCYFRWALVLLLYVISDGLLQKAMVLT